MSAKEGTIVEDMYNLLEKDYRGVNIAVYALATAGLAISIHKIRPVSKFSKASKIPDHFIRNHVPLKGTYAGVQHSPIRLLVNHKAPIYLPLWHSSKPPLPVKIWGVDVVSGNAANWLECVAKGQKVTLKPIAKDNDDLVSTVLLHFDKIKSKEESLDIGHKMVELGLAKAVVPQVVNKNTLESQLAPVLLSAEAHAKTFRNGIWSDALPPLPIYVVYWRKGVRLSKDLVVLAAKKLIEILIASAKSAFVGAKYLTQRGIKHTPKQIQPT